MNKKLLTLTILLLLLAVMPAGAVLKERNLAGTLAMLRIELTKYRQKLENESESQKDQYSQVMNQLLTTVNKSQQNAIMLYSQKSGYVFDLTYACHEATEQYKTFKNTVAPFRSHVENADVEIARFDSLITDLSTMYTANLTTKSQIDRNVCLTLAVYIRRTLNENRTQNQQYITIYNATEQRLKNLNDYANKRYREIQNSIFTNSSEDIVTLIKNLRPTIKETTETVVEKYKPTNKYHSDWDSRIILMLLAIIVFYGVLAGSGGYLVVRFVVTRLVRRKRADVLLKWLFGDKGGEAAQESFRSKRMCIVLAAAVIIFAATLGIVRMSVAQNFLIMASGLLVEYAWLMGVILLSLLIRLDGSQIRHGLRIYVPIMAICFIVITFRVVLIPNIVTSIVLPFLLLFSTLWQWTALRHNKAGLPSSDVFYAWVSLSVFLASDVASLIGYTLLAVEMLIWWTMQLTCILTITCFSNLLKRYGNHPNRRFFDDNTPVSRTWFFRFVYGAVAPIMATLSILLSIYWAADVFNLSDTSWEVFNRPLIATTKLTFSIMRAVQVTTLFFLASYINKVSIHILYYHLNNLEARHAQEEKRKPSQQAVASRIAMWRNLIQVLVWGAWILITMIIFNIDNSWIVAISAGLSTGIGFAMKDILENLYYGISLMAGRIKVGDYISIDGTKGTVKAISYTSTTIEALDGSVIAFQNSQLFSKNYKNLTRNHGNVLSIIPVGVAYGSNMAEVKQTVTNAVMALNKPNYIKFIKVVLAGFGDNSVDFKVLAWVDSRKQTYAESDIMEAVYNAFNEKNIEIPFPQRDIHIVSDTAHLVPPSKTSPIQHADSLEEAEEQLRGSKNL